jgi:tetratricopeptide (TPR) repeat protein
MLHNGKQTFGTVEQTIAKASEYSGRSLWKRAYRIYRSAIKQLDGQVSGRDLARLYSESGVMARNIGVKRHNHGNRFKCNRWFDKAHENYYKAVDADDTYWRPWFNQASLLARDEQRFAQALKYFDQAAELNPEYAEIFNNRGLTYAALNDYTAAERDFQKAIALDPKYTDAHNNLGALYFNRGDYSAAAEWYEKAQKLSPGDIDIKRNLDRAFAQKHR